jgi:hypothetical protein
MILRKLRGENIDDYVDDILKEIDKKIKDWKKDLSLNAKNIQLANVEQVSLLAYYDEIRVDTKSLLEYYEMRVKQVRSEALHNINKHASKDYNSIEKDKMIDSDKTFIKYKQIYLDVYEMYNMLSSISEQFKNRAFMLNNIIKIRAAALEDITLYDDVR